MGFVYYFFYIACLWAFIMVANIYVHMWLCNIQTSEQFGFYYMEQHAWKDKMMRTSKMSIHRLNQRSSWFQRRIWSNNEIWCVIKAREWDINRPRQNSLCPKHINIIDSQNISCIPIYIQMYPCLTCMYAYEKFLNIYINAYTVIGFDVKWKGISTFWQSIHIFLFHFMG